MPKLFICVLLVLTAMLAACSKSKDADEGADENAATPVQVAPAERKAIHSFITAEAVLYPIKQANIVPKISAPVARFLVQRGDHVREGQLLAVLEDRDLIAGAQESKELYRQAQANYQNTTAATIPDDLTKAKADVESSHQALDAARTLYENRQALVHEGALAQKLADDAKVAMVQAQAQFDTAQQHLTSLETVGRAEQVKSIQAQMDAAKAHYESAQAQVGYAEVRSPITGIVSDRPLNIGEMASAGTAMLTVVDISHLTARANMPVQQAALISVGRPATISVGGTKLTGKVTVVSPAVDPSTTTVQVWVEAPNPGEHMKPGATAEISVDAGEIPDAVVVPVAALLSTDEGGDKVMVAGSDSLAHEHPVKVGIRSGDDVQILSGVNAGEQVIVQGGLGLDDKAKIQIAKPGSEDKDEDDKK